ncbi:MAG: beta strand repeat-containing protein, partial [Limisphaerales bacterium]
WLQLATLAANVVSYSDKNLYAGSTWCYRVRSYNSAGNSSYSTVASATTPNNVAPTLAPIQNHVVTPGTLITFTNSATAPDNMKLITDFEAFQSETSNGAVLFETPNTSSSTSNFLNNAPEMDIAAITDTHPTGGQSSGNVLMLICQFTNGNNPWLRLTTAGTSYFADAVIDITRKLRFDMYADQAVQVAVGCRETATAAGTAIGSDGGTSGAIEWAGVTNVAGTAPMPTRTITPNTWTTLTFDFAHEPIRSFSGGNSVLSTISGLGVLEHLAIVPQNGTNTYTFYLDNFSVLYPRTFTYSLGAGAPSGATLDANTGIFSWTPSQAQSPSTNTIAVIVADNSSPPLRSTNTFTVTVSQSSPTVIITQPEDDTANVGSDAMFSVEASGTLLKYQWLFNATNVLAGKTNSTLTVTNCQLTNAGNYSVIVSNTTDTLTSSVAALVVFAPITISTPPVNRTNNIGDNAHFSVAAIGTNLTYQWQFEANNIAGATSSAIDIPVNDITNEGVYTVVVSSPVATNVTSSAALSIPYFDLTKIVQWNFNSVPADNNTNTGVTTPSVGSGTVAPVGGATALFGDSVTSDVASLGLDNTSLLITNYPPSSSGNKIRGIQVNASTVGYNQIAVTWEQRDNARASKYARFQYTTNGTDWIDRNVITDTSYANFQFKVADLWDVDGVSNNPNFAFRIITEWESTATGSGAAAYVPANPSSTYNTDAVIRFDMLTILGSIAEPVIVSQPQSVTQQVGQTAVFNVAATGVGLSYQWQKDGLNLQNDSRISGADTASLTVANISDADAGSFTAIVSTSDGLFSIGTDPATLFVFTPASITQQPQGGAFNAGSAVTLSVSANGTTPITYQWKKDGVNLSGATQPSFSLNSFQSANAGTYTVVVGNGGTPIESDQAILSINVAPSISVEPHSTTVVADNSASFSVTGSGTAPLAYQWRKNAAPIFGETQSSFTIASAKASDAGSYSVVITNVAGSITSSTATLAVTVVKPIIVSQPIGGTNVVGTPIVFNVGATGGALTYQWRKNGARLFDSGRVSGATTSSLTISGVYTTDNGSYSVAVSNSAAGVISSIAVFKAFFAPAIAIQPISRTSADGSSAKFNVTAVGTATLKYQWRKGTNNLVNGMNVFGATAAALTLTGVSTGTVGAYNVVVTNAVGAVTSDAATLDVDTKPLITGQPSSRTDNEGTT